MIEVKKYILKTVEELDNIKSVWKGLDNCSDMTIYQSFDWNRLLFLEEKRRFLNNLFSLIILYVVTKNNKTVAILPLIIQKHSNKTKWFGRKKGLYILGHNSYSDYLNVIYNEEADYDCFYKLINELKTDYNGQKFYITDLKAGSSFYYFIKNFGAVVDNESVSVQVEKKESIEDYNKTLSKSIRQNLRTAKNRMEKANITYEVKVLGKVNDKKLLRELVDLHVERMAEKNMKNTDIIHRISSIIRIKYRIWREYNNNIIKDSMQIINESCLIIVYLNQKIAGYLYGLKDKNVIRIMQNCVKKEYKFYSPLFRGAYDFILSTYNNNEIDIIDFTRGNEKYKYDLGGVELKLSSYHIVL